MPGFDDLRGIDETRLSHFDPVVYVHPGHLVLVVEAEDALVQTQEAATIMA